MKVASMIGIDIAKSVFHVVGTDSKGKLLFKKKCNRTNLLTHLEKYKGANYFMESCAGSNYWAREMKNKGLKIKLISPQFVTPFLKSNKNDYLDAEAIAEAGSRKNMRFVSIKPRYSQDLQLLHRIRERFVKNRTALCNEIRGFLLEYGIEIKRGRKALLSELPIILENESSKLTPIAEAEMSELLEELKSVNSKVLDYDKKIKFQADSNEDCKRLCKLNGVGPIVATAMVAACPDPNQFKNGREFAAFVGVVPRQHSSGGKNNLLGISKRGDTYLRKQLIHGCRSVVYRAHENGNDLQKWIHKKKESRGKNKAVVAFANKNARTIWAVLKKKEDFKFVA